MLVALHGRARIEDLLERKHPVDPWPEPRELTTQILNAAPHNLSSFRLAARPERDPNKREPLAGQLVQIDLRVPPSQTANLDDPAGDPGCGNVVAQHAGTDAVDDEVRTLLVARLAADSCDEFVAMDVDHDKRAGQRTDGLAYGLQL